MARFLKKNKSKHISSPTSNSSSNCSWLLLFLFLRNYIWWFPNGKIFSFVSVLTLFHHWWVFSFLFFFFFLRKHASCRASSSESAWRLGSTHCSHHIVSTTFTNTSFYPPCHPVQRQSSLDLKWIQRWTTPASFLNWTSFWNSLLPLPPPSEKLLSILLCPSQMLPIWAREIPGRSLCLLLPSLLFSVRTSVVELYTFCLLDIFLSLLESNVESIQADRRCLICCYWLVKHWNTEGAQ